MKEFEANTSYYLRISAYTIAGAGPFSEMNFTTTPIIIRSPRHVRAVAVSNDSLEAWWEEVLEHNISGYKVIRIWKILNVFLEKSMSYYTQEFFGRYSILRMKQRIWTSGCTKIFQGHGQPNWIILNILSPTLFECLPWPKMLGLVPSSYFSS